MLVEAPSCKTGNIPVNDKNDLLAGLVFILAALQIIVACLYLWQYSKMLECYLA